MLKCEICNKEFDSLRSLGLHIAKSHKNINSKDYYDTYMKKSNEGICKVCNNPTKYKGGLNGYARTCSISCGQKHPDTRQKMSNTNMKKYGATNPYGSKIIREKIKKSNMKKYGVENAFCISGVNEKAIKNSHTVEAEEKRKQTCLEKYGNEYHIASKSIREKSINSYLERYGVTNAYSIPEINNKAVKNSQSDVAWKKRTAAMKRNGNQSSYETLLENALIDKNISYITQYKEERYPYHCDFYLPEQDLFIEINGYWIHNGHFYDSNNQEDLDTVNNWKNKNSNQYNYAIDVWTRLDIEKLNCAKQNSLNYIVLWNINDIQNFINSL